MLKIRITGLPDEIERFLNELRKRFSISHESNPCRDSRSKFVRKYIDVEGEKKNGKL